MDTLERILRRSRLPRAHYHPFSERSYSGPYPTGSGRRVSPLTSANPSQLLLFHTGLSVPNRSPLSLFEDRRLYHPEGVVRPAISLTESYPHLVERSPYRPIGRPHRTPPPSLIGVLLSVFAVMR